MFLDYEKQQTFKGAAKRIASSLMDDLKRGTITKVSADEIHFAVNAADVGAGATLNAEELDCLEEMTTRVLVGMAG
jgi:hypothetical protein